MSAPPPEDQEGGFLLVRTKMEKSDSEDDFATIMGMDNLAALQGLELEPLHDIPEDDPETLNPPPRIKQKMEKSDSENDFATIMGLDNLAAVQGLELEPLHDVSEDYDPETPNLPPRMTLSTKFKSLPLPKDPPPFDESGANPRPYVNAGQDDDSDNAYVDEDIESLAAKACALASVPIPDYTDAFERKNQKYKTKKYRDKVLGRKRRDKDPTSIVLADKTSNILCEFEDYMAGIESESPGLEILKQTQKDDTATEADSQPRGVIAREWNYDAFDKVTEADTQPSGAIAREWNPGTFDGAHAIKRKDSSGVYTVYTVFDVDKRSDESQHSSSKEKRAHWYTRPFLHSKSFKIGVVWAFVACVLVGTIIGTHFGSGGEDREEEFLKRVQGLEAGQLNRKPEGEAQGKGYAEPETLPHHMGGSPPEAEVNVKEQSPATNTIEGAPTATLLHNGVELPIDKISEGQNKPPNGKGEASAEILPQHVIGLPSEENGKENSSPSENQKGTAEVLHDSAPDLLPDREDEKKNSPPNDHEEDVEATAALSESPVTNQELRPVDMEGYNPKWFARATGWAGRTYSEAVVFCAAQNMTLCSYRAMCPEGPNRGLYRDADVISSGESEEQWSPVSDETNAWVQVGPRETCVLYWSLHSNPPDWGMNGVGSEAITQHILCCVRSGSDEDHTTIQSPAFVVGNEHNDGSISAAPSKSPQFNHDDESADEATMTKYRPQAFDRSSGWIGTTYDEAFQFCTEQGPGHDLCTYDVYCPQGELHRPYGGLVEQIAWAPISDSYNDWVFIGRENPCVRFSTMHPDRPVWGMNGESKNMTGHILCCQTDGEDTYSTTTKTVDEKFEPEWHHRNETSDHGWVGKSYTDSIAYCASLDSAIPCPYEAVCPDGPQGLPTGGSRQRQDAWAPVMDTENGWVNVGSSSDSCELYSTIHSHPPIWGLIGSPPEEELGSGVDVKDITADILCCKEPGPGDEPIALQTTSTSSVQVASNSYEQDILDKRHPVWYGRKHGYHGTTQEEAAKFCRSLGDKVLCPKSVYCPETSGKKLFLQREAFEGEQWAPVETGDIRPNHKWIQIGTLDGERQSTCAVFDDVKGMKPGGWNVDESGPELKEHVLCCLNPNHLLKEVTFSKQLDLIWLDQSFGWNGGSYDQAQEFCTKLGGRRLCPYMAYCPHGPGQPVMGGHAADFNTEGEQWAPASGQSGNYWVMVGRKYGNGATTCMDNWELEGQQPSWGLTEEMAGIKKYIMCCSF